MVQGFLRCPSKGFEASSSFSDCGLRVKTMSSLIPFSSVMDNLILNNYCRRSKIVNLYLEVGEALEVGPPPEQEHELGHADVLPLGPPHEARVLEQPPVGLRVQVEEAQNELVHVLEHARPQAVPAVVHVGRVGLGLAVALGVLLVEGLAEDEQDEHQFPQQPLVDALDQHADELGHDHVDRHNLYPVVVDLLRHALHLLPVLGFGAHVPHQLLREYPENILHRVDQLLGHQVAPEGVEHAGEGVVWGPQMLVVIAVGVVPVDGDRSALPARDGDLAGSWGEPLVLVLDVGVEGGVAQVALAAGADEIPLVRVVASPPLALNVHLPAFHASRQYSINYNLPTLQPTMSSRKRNQLNTKELLEKITLNPLQPFISPFDPEPPRPFSPQPPREPTIRPNCRTLRLQSDVYSLKIGEGSKGSARVQLKVIEHLMQLREVEMEGLMETLRGMK